jgi:hypothetical protein
VVAGLDWQLEGDARVIPFRIDGEVTPITVEVMAKAVHGKRVPSRPLAGWLMVYATLGAKGEPVVLKDRQGHVHEAAKELGHIDWTPYLEKGSWIDNHRWLHPDGRLAEWGTRPEGGGRVHVGRAHSLAFHDGSTPLSLSHRKIGYFTSGELYDRKDPASWTGLGRVPTPYEFERADHYWDLAHMLMGTPRSLCFSADGVMALSKDEAKLMWARVNHAGVCEIPQHPATTAQPMTMGVPTGLSRTPIEIMEMAMATDTAIRGHGVLTAGYQQLPAGLDPAKPGRTTLSEQVERLIQTIMDRFQTDRASAERWVRAYVKDNPHQVLEALNGQAHPPQ